MPTDSSPPAVCPNRTQVSPTTGSGRRSGRATAANPTNAGGSAPAVRTRTRARRVAGGADVALAGLAVGDDAAAVDLDEAPQPVGQADPPGGQQAREVVEVVGRRVVVLGGAQVELSRWPPSTQFRGTQETAVTDDSMRMVRRAGLEELPDAPGPSRTRSAASSSSGGASAEPTATRSPPPSSAAAAKAGRSPRSSPTATSAVAPDSAATRRTASPLSLRTRGRSSHTIRPGTISRSWRVATRAAAWPIGSAQRSGSATRRMWTATA